MNDSIENCILRLYFLLPKLLITLEADDVEDKFESEWWWWWLLLWWVPNVRPMAFITSFYYISHCIKWGILFLYLFGTARKFFLVWFHFKGSRPLGVALLWFDYCKIGNCYYTRMHKCDYFRNEENCLAIKHSR